MILENRNPGRRTSQANFASRRIRIKRVEDGAWLHMNGQTWTRDSFWAWLGTREQTRAMIRALGVTPGVDVLLMATATGGTPTGASPEDLDGLLIDGDDP